MHLAVCEVTGIQMAVNYLREKLTFEEKPEWVKAAFRTITEPTVTSTYTSKGPQPHPPGPDGTKCFCLECAEWKFGPRIPNGFPGPGDDFAGFTCNWCPNHLRPTPCGHSFGGFRDTERCKICSREIKSWQRANDLADKLIEQSELEDRRLRFVTLTLPNYECPRSGLKDLKKKIRNFRHTKKFKSRVSGGTDFYEWTTSSDGSYNVHYHGVWIGNYWKQDDLLDSWKHGGARIELVKKKYEAADTVRYCTKYLTKMKEFGIRTRNNFGSMYS